MLKGAERQKERKILQQPFKNEEKVTLANI